MADWQPIATAPQGPFFLVWGADGVEMAFRNGSGPDEILSMSDCIQIDATHWMPLPEKPNG